MDNICSFLVRKFARKIKKQYFGEPEYNDSAFSILNAREN
jgi:hypothetical protein